MITKVRLQNWRSLKDTGWIAIKPLTLLVGKNSSGKSSFLRWFPLMSQSVSSNLRVPILWYDDNIVDFGDFDTTVTKNIEGKKELIFSFEMKIKQILRYGSFGSFDELVRRFLKNQFIKVSFTYSEGSKGTYISLIAIEIAGKSVRICIDNSNSVELSIEDRKISVGEVKVGTGFKKSAMPTVFFIPSSSSTSTTKTLEFFVLDEIISRLYKLCPRNFSHSERLERIVGLWCFSKTDFLTNLKNFNAVKRLSKKFEKWTVESPEFLELYDYCFLLASLLSLDSINAELVSFFENLEYIAPLRAPGQRFFRNKGLQVSKIDSNGNNLGEYIDSLSGSLKRSYDAYLERVLGIKINIKKGAGHQSLEIVKNTVTYNLTDVGFGYSQILPIVTQLWLSSEKVYTMPRNFFISNEMLTVMEQPELHLHPALQGNMTDALLRIIAAQSLAEHNKDKRGLKQSLKPEFIIETHSSTIVNRVGRRIKESHISADDVQVLIFNKDEKTGLTSISTATYAENGMLEDWPYGFFDSENDPF